MKLDAATVALLLALLACLWSSYSYVVNLEQAARIQRLETALRAVCGANSPTHHTDQCAEISLPLRIPPSPLAGFVSNQSR